LQELQSVKGEKIGKIGNLKGNGIGRIGNLKKKNLTKPDISTRIEFVSKTLLFDTS
jgi:hypothetical protein